MATITSPQEIERLARKHESAHYRYGNQIRDVSTIGIHHPEGGEPQVTIWLEKWDMPGDEYRFYFWSRRGSTLCSTARVLVLTMFEEPRTRERFTHTLELAPNVEDRLRELVEPGGLVVLRCGEKTFGTRMPDGACGW